MVGGERWTARILGLASRVGFTSGMRGCGGLSVVIRLLTGRERKRQAGGRKVYRRCPWSGWLEELAKLMHT